MKKNSTDQIQETQLVSYLLNELSPVEEEKVRLWISSASENKNYFEQFKMAWEKTSVTVNLDHINEEDEWDRFRERLLTEERPPVHYIRFLKVAAAVILFAALAFTLVWVTQRNNIELRVLSGNAISTDTLPDGSIITLNRNSSLAYASSFNQQKREVELSGEAFFSITPNKEKPFIIRVGDVKVKVVGTSFNVRSAADRTEIVVETGIVQLQKGNAVIELHPKEKGTVYKDTALLVKETVKDKLYNYYLSNQFECNGTPLWQLVEALNLAYDGHIIIGNSKIRNYPISATYSGNTLEEIVQVLCRTLQITGEKKGNEIILQ